MKSIFAAETQVQEAFCEAWNAHLSRGTRDPFSWIQELTPAEGLVPFAIAVPSHNHGGATGRSLERRGTWQPELTLDLLDALDQAGSDSVFIDIGAGLGWFSFVAAAANHSALALETDHVHIAAMRRSSCANYYHQSGTVILLSPNSNTGSGSSSGGTTKTQHGVGSVKDILVDVAPRMINALSPASPQEPLPLSGEQKSLFLSERGPDSVVLVHPGTAREALDVMAAGSSVLWPQIKPLIIAMVVPPEGKNVSTSTFNNGDGIATVEAVLHRMHALGYDVKMDAPSNMAQSPAVFASLAAMVARGGTGEAMTVVWFTWKGGAS